MTSLILCEGKTDAIFLSYYLEKVCEWTHKFNRTRIPKGFDVKANKSGGESVEWYHKNDNFLVVCAVGSKDKFTGFVKHKIIPAMLNSTMFSKIALVTDRDDRSIESICQSVQNMFSTVVSSIKNNSWTENIYHTGTPGREASVEFLLLAIPMDKEGALETLLIDSIASHEYDKPIVEKSKAYIADVEPLATKYIGKTRLKLKALLGVIWATQCPEMIFSFIDEQIRSVKWEDSKILTECFSELIKI